MNSCWTCLCVLLTIGIGSAEIARVLVREEDVFSFLTMSTHVSGEPTTSSVVAFEYSYPLLLIRKGFFAKAGQLNLTEDDPEIVYLKSHESYLQNVRTILKVHEGTVAIKSNCTYNHGKISCILTHIDHNNEEILTVTYHFDNPSGLGMAQSYRRQITSTEEGSKIRDLFFRTYNTWEMFEKIHQVAIRWKNMHKNFMETCVAEEVRVEVTVAVSPEPKASCKATSRVPVLFVGSIQTTENDEISAEVSGFKTNEYGVYVSVPVTPRDGMIAVCVVESQMGWTKTEAARLNIRGSEYTLEPAPVPWNILFSKKGSKAKDGRWTLRSFAPGVHPVIQIFVLVAIAALFMVIMSRVRRRRRTDGLHRPPTPPPRRTRQNKKNM